MIPLNTELKEPELCSAFSFGPDGESFCNEVGQMVCKGGALSHLCPAHAAELGFHIPTDEDWGKIIPPGAGQIFVK